MGRAAPQISLVFSPSKSGDGLIVRACFSAWSSRKCANLVLSLNATTLGSTLSQHDSATQNSAQYNKDRFLDYGINYLDWKDRINDLNQ